MANEKYNKRRWAIPSKRAKGYEQKKPSLLLGLIERGFHPKVSGMKKQNEL